ncbi:MAG TPA: PhaM family polyhydroxyalkanoate granule multifunctional regulatory protein [Burkholderiales bacterium]|nr:PhaM family polyhydroxyalkanoate granule multifunctional regulatory protein [Burkholderiales bacterium]
MSQETPLQDPFEFLKKLWSPMGVPMPGIVAPLLDPKEVDKRIADLKSVENWLSMNLNVLRMTIQGLEMQRATLAAFQSMQPQGSAQSAQADSGGAVASAAEAWWSFLQSQTQPPAAPQPEKKPRK